MKSAAAVEGCIYVSPLWLDSKKEWISVHGKALALVRGLDDIDENWINGDFIRLWKAKCDDQHPAICKQFPGNLFKDSWPLWLVNTLEGCLVKGEGVKSYVALSYVWGKVNMFKTLRSNIGVLQSSHPLRKLEKGTEAIPDTIRDAMKCVEVLGERYLWVDALCIVQDDEEEKQKEIPKMSGIFANATVTIVASEGRDASSGLPGLKGGSKPRKFNVPVFKLGDAAIRAENWYFLMDSSSWARRGWTFQEGMFSRRMLFFEYESVTWECRNAIFYARPSALKSPLFSFQQSKSE